MQPRGGPPFFGKCIIFKTRLLGQLLCALRSFLGPSGRPCGTLKAQHGPLLSSPMSIWKVNSRWILTIFIFVIFLKKKTSFGSKRPFCAAFAGTQLSKRSFGINLGPQRGGDPPPPSMTPWITLGRQGICASILDPFWSPRRAHFGCLLAPFSPLRGHFRCFC